VKRGGPSVGKWSVESRHLHGCSSYLCRLRTDGLAPTSKYCPYRSHAGDMGSVSLLDDRQHNVGFAPTASLVDPREKLGTDSWISQSVCCVLCREPFFSGAVALLNSVDDYAKGCYALHMRYVWSGIIHRPSVGYVWRVGRISPVRCTSIRITATLGYEYRLFVAVIT
jgi:hypothetical protein